MLQNLLIRRVLTAFACALVVPLAAAQSALDGKKFDTQAGLTGKAAHVKQDILSFDGVKFHSSDCDQYGYGKGDYKVSRQGDVTTFEVETVSADCRTRSVGVRPTPCDSEGARSMGSSNWSLLAPRGASCDRREPRSA